MDDKLTLEVLVHFVKPDGTRIAPSHNRIKIPLQVSCVNGKEETMLIMLIMWLMNSVQSLLGSSGLRRLVRASIPEQNEALEENSIADITSPHIPCTIQDRIEIQELPCSFPALFLADE